MDFKRFLSVSVVLVFLIGMFFACSALNRYGKIRLARPDEITIEELQKNWDHYDIYWAGHTVAFPAAIMFDPKDNETKLISDAWEPVEDQETLSRIVHNLCIDIQHYLYPKARKILSPDNRLYGYMYTAWQHAVIKVVDENTMWVKDLPHRPVKSEPGGHSR